MEHDRTNRGAIWKNTKKHQDSHPDFTGSLNVEGVEYWVSAWKRKEGASDKAPALSFSIKPKEVRASRPNERGFDNGKRTARQSSAEMGRPPYDDEIPFAPEFR